MILSILIVLISKLFVAQAGIQVILKDADCPYYDESYVADPDIYVDNNNGLYFNLTIVKQLPERVEGHFVIVGASMGEYVIDTGLELQMPLCEMLNEPVLLGPMLRGLGYSEDNCPPQPGYVGNEGYTLPNTLFPDNFPANQYRAAFEATLDGDIIFTLHIFVDIQ